MIHAIRAAGAAALLSVTGLAAAHDLYTPCEPARFLEIAEPRIISGVPPRMIRLPRPVWISVESIESVREFHTLDASHFMSLIMNYISNSIGDDISNSIGDDIRFEYSIRLDNYDINGIDIRLDDEGKTRYIDVDATLGDVQHRVQCRHPHEKPAPDLVVRDARVVQRGRSVDWSATVENIGEATATTTTIHLFDSSGDDVFKSSDPRGKQPVPELAPGATQSMSHSATFHSELDILTSIPLSAELCVAPVADEPHVRTNNCATVRVERN